MNATAATDTGESTQGSPHDTVSSSCHPVLATAFRALDSHGVTWALLRGAGELERPEGDVDILVAASGAAALDGILEAVGMSRLSAPGRGSHRFYYAYYPDDDLWLKLDVVLDLSFGPFQDLHCPLAATCLSRRTRQGGLWRLAPEDEAWLLLLHLLLDKGQVTPARLPEAAEAAATAASSDDLGAFLDSRTSRGTAERVLLTLQAGDAAATGALAGDISLEWHRRSPVRTRFAGLKNKAFRRLALPTWGQGAPGLLVAIIGPDGAGKTTLARGIAGHFPAPTHYVYLGLWRTGSRGARRQRLAGMQTAIRIGQLLRGTLAARYHCSQGRLVLMDRFVYDALLTHDIDASAGGRLVSMLSPRLAPKPGLVLVLDAPGEQMFDRKGEHSAQVLERRRSEYLAMAQTLPRAAVLDASVPADQVRRRALELVWHRFVHPVAEPVSRP